MWKVRLIGNPYGNKNSNAYCQTLSIFGDMSDGFRICMAIFELVSSVLLLADVRSENWGEKLVLGSIALLTVAVAAAVCPSRVNRVSCESRFEIIECTATSCAEKKKKSLSSPSNRGKKNEGLIFSSRFP